MQIDVLENNNLDNTEMWNTVHEDVLKVLHNEIQNMNVALGINVQLLSRKNMLQFQQYTKELTGLIHDRLSDASKEVKESELYRLTNDILFPILKNENEELFHAKYEFIKVTNGVLKEHMEETLFHNTYQDCLLEMNVLIENFEIGIHRTDYIIDLTKKIDSLNYQLAMTYKLHSSIELYMDIKKLVEQYKVAFHEVYEHSLRQLQYDNFDNAIKVKESISNKMQEHKYQEYSGNESKRTIA